MNGLWFGQTEATPQKHYDLQLSMWTRKGGEYHISDKDLFNLLDLTKASASNCCNTFVAICKKTSTCTYHRSQGYTRRGRNNKG